MMNQTSLARLTCILSLFTLCSFAAAPFFAAQTFAAQIAGQNETTNGKIKVTCVQTKAALLAWTYCLNEVPGSTNEDVLYFFHGLYGDEHNWERAPEHDTVYKTWGSNAPKVVTISYGPLWILAEKNASPLSGLYEHFLTFALPAIEKNFQLKPAHRLLLGLSMGGFNASQLFLKAPTLFAKVGFACPALTTINPYSSDSEIAGYEQRTGASPSYVDRALAISKAYFPTTEAWSKASPLDLAKSLTNSSFPPIFISGGLQDEYGFFEGSAEFVKFVSANGASATWESLAGKHCTWDAAKTAQFFLPESL